MQLSCPTCGAALEADGAAIRRRMLVCDSCGTHARLEAGGLVSSAQAVQNTAPPAGVRVHDLPDGGLVLEVPGSAEVVVIGRNDLRAGVLILAVAAGVGVLYGTDLGGLAAICSGFAYLILRFSVLKEWTRHTERVQLSGGVIRGRSAHMSVAVEQVVQLYTAAPQVSMGEQARVVLPALWALRKDGQRTCIAGPFRSVDDALYVEGRLELHMGLFDREVHGQSSRAADFAAPLGTQPQPVSLAPLPDGPIGCGSCGAAMDVDAATQRCGVADCGYCGTRTLLVDLETMQPLGGFDEDAAWKTLIVVRSGDALRAAWRTNAQIAFEIENGVLSWPMGRWGLNRIQAVMPDLERLPQTVNSLEMIARIAERQSSSTTMDWMDADHIFPAHASVELLVYPVKGKPRKLLKHPVTAWEAGTIQREIRRRLQT